MMVDPNRIVCQRCGSEVWQDCYDQVSNTVLCVSCARKITADLLIKGMRSRFRSSPMHSLDMLMQDLEFAMGETGGFDDDLQMIGRWRAGMRDQETRIAAICHENLVQDKPWHHSDLVGNCPRCEMPAVNHGDGRFVCTPESSKQSWAYWHNLHGPDESLTWVDARG